MTQYTDTVGSVIFRTMRTCLLFDLIVLKITDPTDQHYYFRKRFLVTASHVASKLWEPKIREEKKSK